VRVQELAQTATDPDAFERFYRQHVEAVQRFVARRVEDPYLAADLTADVFVAVIESAGSYRPSRGEPVAWLFGIARNVVAGERRRRAKELRMAARIRGRELLAADDVAALHELIDREAAGRELLHDLSRLPESERAVLELVALDGLSVGEAGQALGIGPVAARVRLHRARRRMRNRLDLLNLGANDRPEVTTWATSKTDCCRNSAPSWPSAPPSGGSRAGAGRGSCSRADWRRLWPLPPQPACSSSLPAHRPPTP
jgi:RNA polymerase sigma-70 factor (ECF subfamily)